MSDPLIEDDGNDYSGQYVIVDGNGTKAVAHDKDAAKAVAKAKKEGCANPVIIYIGEVGVISIYKKDEP